MREVLAEEDMTKKLKYENKIDGHLDILYNSLSRDDKNRIQSLKKNSPKCCQSGIASSNLCSSQQRLN